MTTAPRCFELTLLPERFAISQPTTNAVIAGWATQESWFSFARTSDELSVVCEHIRVPAGVRSQPGWSALKVRGPFALAEICVLSALASTLAATKLSWFTISACNTDHLLVASESASAAISALARAGHRIHRSWKE